MAETSKIVTRSCSKMATTNITHPRGIELKLLTNNQKNLSLRRPENSIEDKPMMDLRLCVYYMYIVYRDR